MSLLGLKGSRDIWGGGVDQDSEFDDQPCIHNEWGSRLVGPNGGLLLLVSVYCGQILIAIA